MTAHRTKGMAYAALSTDMLCHIASPLPLIFAHHFACLLKAGRRVVFFDRFSSFHTDFQFTSVYVHSAGISQLLTTVRGLCCCCWSWTSPELCQFEALFISWVGDCKGFVASLASSLAAGVLISSRVFRTEKQWPRNVARDPALRPCRRGLTASVGWEREQTRTGWASWE